MLTKIGYNDEIRVAENFTPYLLQVLEKRSFNINDNPDAARAALIDGTDPMPHSGLSQTVAMYLDRLFSWKYMGAAEYEWRAIPRAVQYLAAYRYFLVTTQFTLPGCSLPLNDWARQGGREFDELAKLRKAKRLSAEKKARKEVLEKIFTNLPQNLTLYYLGPSEYV